MIKLPEKIAKERFKDLQNKEREKMAESQKDFVTFMRLKEEIKAGLEGF